MHASPVEGASNPAITAVTANVDQSLFFICPNLRPVFTNERPKRFPKNRRNFGVWVVSVTNWLLPGAPLGDPAPVL